MINTRSANGQCACGAAAVVARFEDSEPERLLCQACWHAEIADFNRRSCAATKEDQAKRKAEAAAFWLVRGIRVGDTVRFPVQHVLFGSSWHTGVAKAGARGPYVVSPEFPGRRIGADGAVRA